MKRRNNKDIKILITGGSGFLGTNLVESCLNSGYCVLNIDIALPKIKSHHKFWKKIDILDKTSLFNAFIEFTPTHVIHLAARTDLRGSSLSDYNANIEGVENIISACNSSPRIKNIIFSSSMLVCALGYSPLDDYDFSPNTVYGKSKVESEKIIRAANIKTNWAIIRPTSIWGQYFNEPYKNYFELIISKKYFNILGNNSSKTYGYIGNTVYQIEKLLFSNEKNISGRVFYIGDYNYYNINEWSKEIANVLNTRIYSLPKFIFRIAAFVGDILGLIQIKFPMNSFRLENMTTNNTCNLDNIRKVAPTLPFSRLEGVRRTVRWLTND